MRSFVDAFVKDLLDSQPDIEEAWRDQQIGRWIYVKKPNSKAKKAVKQPKVEEIHQGVYYGMKYGKKKPDGKTTFGFFPETLTY